jgi:hypothetical protein
MGPRDPDPPASGPAEACAVFAEPFTAEVRFGGGPEAALEQADVMAMPTYGCHQPGETCQVSFELNGARRVMACTIFCVSFR